MPAPRIGERLVAEGKLSNSAVRRALGYQRLSGDRVRLGSILLAWRLVPEETLLQTLAQTHHCGMVTWDTLLNASMEVVKLLPSGVAIRLGALPYAFERGAVRVAFHDPSNLAAVDEVTALIGKRIIPAITSEVRLMQAHQKFYGRHLPQEIRAIVLKLDRETRAERASRAGVDFRAGDVVAFEKNAAGLSRPLRPRGAAPELGSVSLERSSVEIPIASDVARLELVTEGDGSLGERAALPPPPDFYSPEPPSEDRNGQPELSPFPVLDRASAGGVADPASASSEVPNQAATLSARDVEDFDAAGPQGPQSLTSWIADAIGSVDGTYPRPPALSPSPVAPPLSPSLESAAAALPPDAIASEVAAERAPAPSSPEETVAEGMWRSSEMNEHEDAIVSGMWRAAGIDLPTSPGWEPESREEIADALFEMHLAVLPRIVLLDCSKAGILGWQGRGEGVSQSRLSEVLIPLGERSVFAHVERSGVPHFGTLDRELWPRAFSNLFGSAPPECAVFPIRILEGVAAFLYADRLGRPMLYGDFALLARAAAWTSSALSQVFRRHRASPVG